MGKKRKHERSEEEIRRKIQKLTEKLAAKTTSLDVLSPNDFNPSPLNVPYNGSSYQPYDDSVPDTFRYEESPLHVSPSPLSPQLVPLQQPPTPRRWTPQPMSPIPSEPAEPTASQPPQPGPSTSADKGLTSPEEPELDEEILQLLGDVPKEDTSMGPAIHKDIAARWQNILAKGLPKDVRENICKDYLVPNNCDFLVPPTLNPEVKAALPTGLVKRDSSLMYRQKQLSIALSALASLTEKIISNETSKQKLLKPLSDACRILCDSHFSETRTRRDFVISSINVKLKDTLIETSRDKLLFGENVSEKLKVAKTIQQSGNALKNVQKPSFQSNVPSTSANKGRLNFVAQHRKVNQKQNDGRRTSNQTQRQSQNNSARRPRERPTSAKSRPANRR